MRQISLCHHDPARVCVVELRGRDELDAHGAGTLQAVRLLSAVVEQPGGEPIDARQLTTTDRDVLLAAVWQQAFGDHVRSTVDCRECDEPFDLAFSIQALVESVVADTRADRPATVSVDGAQFRLPTAADELAIGGLDQERAAAELVERCRLEGEAGRPAAVIEAFEQAAPMVSLELDATCPECQAAQTVDFDLQSFVLQAIADQHQHTTYEIHCLARAYGWSLAELASLTRSQRKAFVHLIDLESSRKGR